MIPFALWIVALASALPFAPARGIGLPGSRLRGPGGELLPLDVAPDPVDEVTSGSSPLLLVALIVIVIILVAAIIAIILSRRK